MDLHLAQQILSISSLLLRWTFAKTQTMKNFPTESRKQPLLSTKVGLGLHLANKCPTFHHRF
ncbi:hypothetical protein M23134_00832 [Microscilla marina ATCC 23134]|uniref:Uncharacterized protein n=1 Tax=Microscilla marina ATCC 23134 TaxID=313606 RepID=A1ZVZ6_MICM2|nr:hypothetical protein M23134_00832 [Microscilla marina ATCC 23134]